MKLLCIFISFIYSTGLLAQVCNPNSNISIEGLPTANDSTPCVVQGQAYAVSLSFRNFSTINIPNQIVPLDSIRIDSITNLPCGLTWATSKSSRIYYPSEIGCIVISGTTSDPVGQYKMNMALTMYVPGSPVAINAVGFAYSSYIKVKASQVASCPIIDTSTSATNLLASCITPTPIIPVWPGDANYDGIVDANDVLHMAIVYGFTGPIRIGANINWVAQPATDWADFPYWANNKHADADGNGIINTADTLAVTQNYSLTHFKTEGQKAQGSDPIISLIPSTDTIRAGEDFHIKIMLGEASNQVDSLYGIAFSMNLDPNIFDTTSVQLSLGSSWLGNSGNGFTFRKAMISQGKIDMVITRNDHQNASGYGQIGELVLKTQAHVYTNATTLNLTPTVIKGITANGTTKTYNTQSTTVSITGIEEATIAQYITLYPNPSNGHFTLTVAQPSKTLNIQLLNIQGQQLYTEQLKDQSHYTKDFNLSDLAKGVYLLKVSTENGVAVKRVVVE